MKDRILRNLLVLLLAAVVVAYFGLLTRWRWKECRQVGHGRLYCVGKVLGE